MINTQQVLAAVVTIVVIIILVAPSLPRMFFSSLLAWFLNLNIWPRVDTFQALSLDCFCHFCQAQEVPLLSALMYSFFFF